MVILKKIKKLFGNNQKKEANQRFFFLPRFIFFLGIKKNPPLALITKHGKNTKNQHRNS